MMITRGKGNGGGRRGYRGVKMKGDLAWGGEHTI